MPLRITARTPVLPLLIAACALLSPHGAHATSLFCPARFVDVLQEPQIAAVAIVKVQSAEDPILRMVVREVIASRDAFEPPPIGTEIPIGASFTSGLPHPFPTGTMWVVALRRIARPKSDVRFYILDCGPPFLRILNGKAVGPLNCTAALQINCFERVHLFDLAPPRKLDGVFRTSLDDLRAQVRSAFASRRPARVDE